MNEQKCVLNGYYIHYKGMPYQLVDLTKDSDTMKDMVTYKALYTSKDFGKHMRWSKQKDEFFKDIELEGKTTPRFKFVGTTIDELITALKDCNSQTQLILD